MLGPTYRFTIQNKTGQTLAANACTLLPRRYKLGTDGSLTIETSGTGGILQQTSTVANLVYHSGTTQDNTTNKYIGGFFEFTVTAPASSSGSVVLTIEYSVDGGTTWPDAGLGEWVATIPFTTAGTKRIVFEL